MRALYIETSAVLRAILEAGVTPDVEAAIASADILVTSRLSLVESARAVLRARLTGRFSEMELNAGSRDLTALWSRCHIVEITPEICNLAAIVAPSLNLRTLDAIHVATFQFAAQKIENLSLLSVDRRVLDALGVGAP